MTKALFRVPQGTVLYDQFIPNRRYGTPDATPWDLPFHKHPVDIYIPAEIVGRDNVVSLLHGGGNLKYVLALQLQIVQSKVKSPQNVNWGMLNKWKAVVYIPQGQFCTGVQNPWNPNGIDSRTTKFPRGVPVWTCHGFWSENDDIQFLKDLAITQASDWPGALRILGGHSAGGMMVYRAYVELQQSYHVWVSICGPAPIPQFEEGEDGERVIYPPGYPDVTFPYYTWPNPTTTISGFLGGRFFQMYGGNDDVLAIRNGLAGIGDHWLDSTWIQNPKNLGRVDVDYPQAGTRLSGLEGFFAQCRSQGYDVHDLNHANVGTVTANQFNYTFLQDSSKNITTPNGSPFVVQYVAAPGHSLKSQRNDGQQSVFEKLMSFSRRQLPLPHTGP